MAELVIEGNMPSTQGAGDGSLQAPERRRRTRTSQQVIVTMEGRWKRICALNELI